MTVQQFPAFAGQLVKNGIGPNAPFMAFGKKPEMADLMTMEGEYLGRMAKLGNAIIHGPKVFANPLDAIITKGSIDHGVGYEDIEVEPLRNQKIVEGKCYPTGPSAIKTQLNIANFAYNVEYNVNLEDAKKVSNSAEEAANLVAQKVLAKDAIIAKERYAAWKKMVSYVSLSGGEINETISSNDNSDGTGTAVTYSIQHAEPLNGVGDILEITDISDTRANANKAIDAICEAVIGMRYPDRKYTRLGNETWIGTPNVVIADIDAYRMDKLLGASEGANNYPIRGFSAAMAEMGVNVIRVDKLDAPPQEGGAQVKAVVLDSDMLRETVISELAGAQQCLKAKGMPWGHSHQGEYIYSAYRGRPCYALGIAGA